MPNSLRRGRGIVAVPKVVVETVRRAVREVAARRRGLTDHNVLDG
jgi:hypothetical protein